MGHIVELVVIVAVPIAKKQAQEVRSRMKSKIQVLSI
jgi:hypothetical protein